MSCGFEWCANPLWHSVFVSHRYRRSGVGVRHLVLGTLTSHLIRKKRTFHVISFERKREREKGIHTTLAYIAELLHKIAVHVFSIPQGIRNSIWRLLERLQRYVVCQTYRNLSMCQANGPNRSERSEEICVTILTSIVLHGPAHIRLDESKQSD